MRTAARKDANEAYIVAAFRDLGAHVYSIGLPVDLLVGINGKTALVEVKTDSKKKFTPLQQVFIASWKGSPVVRVQTVDDAMALVKEMRK